MGFFRDRRRVRRSADCVRLCRGRNLWPYLYDAVAAWLAYHRDWWLAPVGLQLPGLAVRPNVAAMLRRLRRPDCGRGIFFAARLATAGGDIGVGLEITVLTAAVLGGISLGGGKGSVAKAFVGTLIVLLITNGLTTMQAPAASIAWCWRRFLFLPP